MSLALRWPLGGRPRGAGGEPGPATGPARRIRGYFQRMPGPDRSGQRVT